MSRRNRTSEPLASRPIRPILAAARAEAGLARHGYVGMEHLLISLTRPEEPRRRGSWLDTASPPSGPGTQSGSSSAPAAVTGPVSI